MTNVLYWAGAIVAVTGALFALSRTFSSVRATGRRWDDFLDDWHGTPARPGRPKVPGVMERLVDLETTVHTVKHELFPNSGASLRDSLDRLEKDVGKMRAPVDAMAASLDTTR